MTDKGPRVYSEGFDPTGLQGVVFFSPGKAHIAALQLTGRRLRITTRFCTFSRCPSSACADPARRIAYDGSAAYAALIDEARDAGLSPVPACDTSGRRVISATDPAGGLFDGLFGRWLSHCRPTHGTARHE